MLSRRTALSLGGSVAAAAWLLSLGWWWSSDGPGAVQAVADPLRPRHLTEMGWTLTDQTGAAVRPMDWVGRPTMAFFGFTFCPDVCPATLINITGWLEELDSDADRLNVALITVDPERDTPEVLAEYLDNFDARIAGLTGKPEEVARALTDFRATAERIAAGDGYTMKHTAGVFLFRADGSFGNVIDFHENPAFALPKIRRSLG